MSEVRGPMWIIITIVLGVVAHALFFIVIPKIACGEGVHRDFERSLKYLPLVIDTPEKRRSAKNGKWPSLREVAGSEVAAKYVFPVLFPLDLIMMAFLAAFLAAGSVTFAAYVSWVPNRIGLLIALPILYFVVDAVSVAFEKSRGGPTRPSGILEVSHGGKICEPDRRVCAMRAARRACPLCLDQNRLKDFAGRLAACCSGTI